MKSLFIASLILHAVTSYAQVDPVNKEGIAIDGYDLVSYFQTGKPQKGNSSFKHVYQNITYYFVDQNNLAAFKENPGKYLPQYEGFCALGVSYGKKISIDPLTYKIIDNKLYLFYNGKTTQGSINSLITWNKDESRLLKRAESQWPDVKKRKYKTGDTL
jgi:YHS domain-containing protein